MSESVKGKHRYKPMRDMRRVYVDTPTTKQQGRSRNKGKFDSRQKEFLNKCREKMDKEDTPFLNMIQYYEIMIELGYKKENE